MKKIGTWVFLALSAVIVVVSILFYINTKENKWSEIPAEKVIVKPSYEVNNFNELKEAVKTAKENHKEVMTGSIGYVKSTDQYYEYVLIKYPMTPVIIGLGYVLLVLSIFLAIYLAVFAAFVKGVNVKTMGIIFAAIAVLAIIAYLMSMGSFQVPYYNEKGEMVLSALGHGFVEFGLVFTYLTAGVSVLAILFSTIYKSVK